MLVLLLLLMVLMPFIMFVIIDVNIGFVSIGFVDPRCEHRVCEPYNLWILDVNIGCVKSAVDQPQQPQQPPAARAARAASVNIGFGEHWVCEHRVCEHLGS